MPTTKAFKGLSNVSDSLRLGVAWLAQADNIDITDTGAIKKRTGYRKAFAGAITGAYSTLDFTRMFVVDGGALKVLTGPGAATSLRSGISPALMHFTEVNDQVFFNNGTDSGIIAPDNTVVEWGWQAPAAPAVTAVTGQLPAGTYQVRCTFTMPDGRETGAGESAEITLVDGQALQATGLQLLDKHFTSVYIAPADSTVYQRAFTSVGATAFVWNDSPDNLGVDLLTNFYDPLPLGSEVIQFWRGRMYAAQYFAAADQTAIWFSQPLGFHLFDLNQDFILVPGRATMLAPHDSALVIGTEARVFAYDGTKLEQLAPYGVVPGDHWARDDERVLFWSTRGLCAAMPFTNLTEGQVSVAPGVSAGGTLVLRDGRKRYLVALRQGGAAFNPLSNI